MVLKMIKTIVLRILRALMKLKGTILNEVFGGGYSVYVTFSRLDSANDLIYGGV